MINFDFLRTDDFKKVKAGNFNKGGLSGEVSDEGKDLLQRCVNEFRDFISTEAKKRQVKSKEENISTVGYISKIITQSDRWNEVFVGFSDSNIKVSKFAVKAEYEIPLYLGMWRNAVERFMMKWESNQYNKIDGFLDRIHNRVLGIK